MNLSPKLKKLAPFLVIITITLSLLSTIIGGLYYFAPGVIDTALEMAGASPLKPSQAAATAAVVEAESSDLIRVSNVRIISMTDDTTFGRIIVTATADATFTEDYSKVRDQHAAKGNTTYANELKARYGEFSRGETKTVILTEVLIHSHAGHWTAYSPELIG